MYLFIIIIILKQELHDCNKKKFHFHKGLLYMCYVGLALIIMGVSTTDDLIEIVVGRGD